MGISNCRQWVILVVVGRTAVPSQNCVNEVRPFLPINSQQTTEYGRSPIADFRLRIGEWTAVASTTNCADEDTAVSSLSLLPSS